MDWKAIVSNQELVLYALGTAGNGKTSDTAMMNPNDV